MYVSGTDIAQTLSTLLLGVVVIALLLAIVAGVQKRRGSTSVALDMARALSYGWIVLCVVGIPFVLYNTLVSAELSVDVPLTSSWPTDLPCGESAVVEDGPALVCASLQGAWMQIQGATAGPRVLLALAGILGQVAMAAPAVALYVLSRYASRGTPFTPAVPRWFLITAAALVVAGGLQEALSMLGSGLAAREVLPSGGVEAPPTFAMSLPLWPLAAALALVALAAVFRHGLKLQRDTEGLV